MKNRLILILTGLLAGAAGAEALTFTKTIGWNEAAAVEWSPVAQAVSYKVDCVNNLGEKISLDPELIRYYPGYMRADQPGLCPGEYHFEVYAFDGAGNELENGTSETVGVKQFIREGFAFRDNYVPGAYNADGTPKPDSQIIYVTAKNANSLRLTVVNDAKNKTVDAEGIAEILKAYNRGYDKRPLIIRIVGCVPAENITGLKGGNYLEFTGANTAARRVENVTIEGVGNDATLYGYGVFTKRSRGIEVRNLGIMLFGDDGISMEADNNNNWVHHCDFFYGKPGSDKDQVKGDGSIDMKYATTDITIDHNHFWDCGKTTFAGGATESSPIYFTYHHNWFDHTDSRCPRLCHATTHIYNNYFDANPTMSLLSTENTSAFVEANYYRNCTSPMEINMQGTNKKRWPDGSQDGGMNKAYNNIFEGAYELVTQHDNPTDFDAYVVETRDEQIPETVKSLKGGNVYNNFDTAPDMYAVTPDNPEDVPAIVSAAAGRMEGGDLKWTFNNATDDKSTDIDQNLKNMLLNYKGAMCDPYVVVSGIEFVESDGNSQIEYFDLTGRRVADTTLTPGVYVMRQGCKVAKVMIR